MHRENGVGFGVREPEFKSCLAMSKCNKLLVLLLFLFVIVHSTCMHDLGSIMSLDFNSSCIKRKNFS